MRKPVFALAAVLGLLVSAGAHANPTLTFGSQASGGTLGFTSTDIGGGDRLATLSFNNSLIQVTPPTATAGDTGVVNGSFSFLKSAIDDADPTGETAPLFVSGPDPVLTITSGSGGTFTATMTGGTITNSVASFGPFAFSTTVALSLANLAYTGTENNIYKQLAASGVGAVNFGFLLNTNMTLTDFANAPSSGPYTYQGMVVGQDTIAAPEPGPIVLTALATLPLMGIYLRKRRPAA